MIEPDYVDLKPLEIIREVVNDPVKAITKVIKEPVKVLESAVKAVDRVVSNPEDDLLELIARGEGTTDAQAQRQGYNNGYEVTLGYGIYADDKTKRITSMTLGELKAMQAKMLSNPKNKFNSSASGKWQIVKKTLIGLQKNLGLDDSVIYSPYIQRKMAVALLYGRGYAKFKAGTMSRKAFQLELAKEWASVEDPYKGDGRSYYPGAAHTKTAALNNVLSNFA